MEWLLRLFSPANRATFFAATGGLASVVIGLVILVSGSVLGFALIGLGLVIWVLAGTANRWQRLIVKLPGVSLDTRLATMEHGEEFTEAAKDAPDSVLEAVIPLLRQDVASEVMELGPAFAGKRLVDPELGWLRPELNVTVFAIQRPGDGDDWIAGGRIHRWHSPRARA